MDQLTAYRILGLEPGCSRTEIKEAYAALSKIYHPEDYPEKFQELSEAYQTLIRGGRRSNSLSNQENSFTSRTEESDFSFSDDLMESEPEETYDFEETLRRTKEADAKRLHEEVLRALAEFKVLTTPSYCKKLKLFKEYFKKPEHHNAFRSPEFIKELSYLVDESNLKKQAYYEIVSFYHLMDKDRNKIIPEAQLLYDALGKKVDIKAQPVSANKLLPFAVLPVIIRAFRASLRGGEQFTAFVILFLFVCACAWIYRKIKKRFSHVAAQIVTLICVNAVLFFTYALDEWNFVVKNPDTMLNIVVYTLLLSIGWIIGLILFVIIRKIIRSIKK